MAEAVVGELSDVLWERVLARNPVAALHSGRQVETLPTGGPDVLPQGSNFDILPDHRAIHSGLEPHLGAHILTGPIAVDGAEPGDVLEVQILAADPRQNWGYTRIRPLSGTLPEDFPIRKTWRAPLCRWRKSAAGGCRPRALPRPARTRGSS